MAFEILGIGTATPPHRIAQQEAAEWANSMSLDSSHHTTVTKLYRRVGVRTRHSVLLTADEDGIPAHKKLYKPATCAEDLGPSVAPRMRAYETAAGPLAVEAARNALQDASCEPQQITHLITVSCSGFASPGLDIALARELSLRPDVQRTHIGFMGCHGALNGLRVARAFAESNPRARVLLCAVELCSLHHQYQGGADQIVANALFADGAAAIVGGDARHIVAVIAPRDEARSEMNCRGRNDRDIADLVSHSSFVTRSDDGHDNARPAWQLVSSESTIIPDTEPFMTWHIRDHGFQMGLSPQVPVVIERELRPWLETWLSRYELTIDSIGSWAIHPGGPKILQASAKALGLSDDRLQTSQDVLADYGNMSSPTVLFIVERLRREQQRLPCVMLAFGPGLTAEAGLWVEGKKDRAD